MSGTIPSALHALTIRSWTLDLLCDNAPSVERVAHEHPSTWALFLRSERCSAPLRSRLTAAALGRLPPEIVRLLESHAARELQRVLSARGQLRLISDLAKKHGIDVIVLKGGATVLNGPESVDLADVDVLVPAEQATVLAAHLEQRGYRATSGNSVAHLAPLHTAEAVPLEVHFGIAELDGVAALQARAVAVESGDSLRKLSPADHLWHLLLHCVVAHPYRRGRLRDVVLTACAVRDCSRADLHEVARRVAQHGRRAPLGAMLALALGVGGRETPGDPFRAEAAARYLLASRYRWLSRSRALGPSVGITLFALLGSRSDRKAEWSEVLNRPPLPSTWPLLATWERRSPRLGGAARRLLRVGRLALARVIAWPIAARARRLSQQPGS